MYFSHLRVIPWDPTFSWKETSKKSADQINSFHEDYPKYVDNTRNIMKIVVMTSQTPVSKLQAVHGFIFDDQPYAGKWRDVNVRVGLHHPPPAEALEILMSQLEELYTISDLDTLVEWYKDFETIHPFQDGNGRVGGVIVAAYSHELLPDRGWLTVEQ